MKPASVISVAAILLGILGCSGTPPPRLVPAHGRITVNGKPLPAGIMVVFYPDAEKGNTSKKEPRGTTEADGVYELRTGEDPGAPVGFYRVTVFAIKPLAGTEMKPPEWLANQRYSDVKTSRLTAELVEGSTKSLDFDLSR